jgi:hypothetical protein
MNNHLDKKYNFALAALKQVAEDTDAPADDVIRALILLQGEAGVLMRARAKQAESMEKEKNGSCDGISKHLQGACFIH